MGQQGQREGSEREDGVRAGAIDALGNRRELFEGGAAKKGEAGVPGAIQGLFRF